MMDTMYESTNVFPRRRLEDVRTYGLLELHCGAATCSPLRDSRSDGVAQSGFDFFMKIIFLVFGLSGFPSERVAPRRFFQSSLRKTAFCVFLFFVTAFNEIKQCGSLDLL